MQSYQKKHLVNQHLKCKIKQMTKLMSAKYPKIFHPSYMYIILSIQMTESQRANTSEDLDEMVGLPANVISASTLEDFKLLDSAGILNP